MAAGIALPLLLIGGASGAFYLRLHQQAGELSIAHLPKLETPKVEQRILVLSPHCDDETLGVGAYIADARRQNTPVTVAFLTNGDGFSVAARRELGEVNLTPSDYVRFAEVRQKEARNAAHELGVANENVKFLGYPDRGLKPMWETNWEPSHLYRSAYTGHTHSPYGTVFTKRAPYCGSGLLTDLVKLLRETKPTDIFVTHPCDDHPDHYAAAAFAQAALQTCLDETAEGKSKDTWAASAKMHYYIVHRGDWPLPQGMHPDRPLTPPSGLSGSDTTWSAYPASETAQEEKSKALSAYKSQLAICSRFLHSFVRTNEIFGTLAKERISLDAPVFAHDGSKDDVMRYADSAADMTLLSVRRLKEKNTLKVRLLLRGVTSSRVQYTLQIRGEAPPLRADGTESPVKAALLTVRLPIGKRGSRSVETTIPLSDFGDTTPRCIWVGAETRYVGTGNITGLRPIDRLGYRPFLLEDTPSAPP